MSKKYKYIKETNEVEDVETHIKYPFNKKNKIGDEMYYFKKYERKDGTVSIYEVNAINCEYKDKSKINKSTLYNTIRECNNEKLKKIHNFIKNLK